MVKQGLFLLRDKFSYFSHWRTTPAFTSNNDLFIVEYPKSGITWLTSIIASCCLMESGIRIRPTHYNLEQIIGDVHINRNIATNHAYPYYRLIKSHATYNPFYRHVVYLMRNPLSVMKSYYHFVTSHDGFHGSIYDFVKSRKHGISSWIEHVNSWINPKREMKFHLIRYEDLHDDAISAMKNLFSNIGLDIADDTVRSSIEYCSFDSMRESNNLYRKHSPARSYDFIREGRKTAEMDNDSISFIKSRANTLMKKFYPELL